MDVLRYRSRPVEVETVTLDANNMREVADWCGGFRTADLIWDYSAGAYKDPRDDGLGWFFSAHPRTPGVVIPMGRRDLFATETDVLIRDVSGQFQVSGWDEFMRTYDPVAP